ILNGQLIELIMYNAIFYFIFAVLIIVVNPNKVLYGNKTYKYTNEDHDLSY
ncbi:CPBP family intramembrane glutamate endopeptidase, partial [Bacillus mobilis]